MIFSENFVDDGEKFTGAQGTSAKEAATYDFSEKVAAKQGATPKSPPVQQPPAVPDRKLKPVIEESRGTGRGLEIDLIDLHITDQEMRQGQILRDFKSF